MIEFDLVEQLNFLQDGTLSIESEISIDLLNNKQISQVISGRMLDSNNIQICPFKMTQP
jgi:hypothetical protein